MTVEEALFKYKDLKCGLYMYNSDLPGYFPSINANWSERISSSDVISKTELFGIKRATIKIKNEEIFKEKFEISIPEAINLVRAIELIMDAMPSYLNEFCEKYYFEQKRGFEMGMSRRSLYRHREKSIKYFSKYLCF